MDRASWAFMALGKWVLVVLVDYQLVALRAMDQQLKEERIA